ncbi:hypothetical protein JCM11641_008079 [Rhodosporidiobolus odoratus]
MGGVQIPYILLPTSARAALQPLCPPERSKRRTSALAAFAVVAFLFLFRAAAVRRPPEPSPSPEDAWVAHRTGTSRSLFAKWLPPPLPRAVRGDHITFNEYLDYHFPSTLIAEAPHVWVTLADVVFAKTGAAVMHHFVQQLNQERAVKYGGEKRETRLVTLCLDEQCVEECERREMFAYGGFERTRPEQILKATWPKLASLIQTLPHRDVFFVDSDVFFAQDPYPYMEPLMEEYDILAQENDALEHFNTGWLWLRKGARVAEAWTKVLEMDMKETSRDQVNFNTVLGTGQLRLHDNGDPFARPLKSNFTAQNGLRVHVLDSRLFRTYHQRDAPWVSRHDSVYVHATCCDDAWVKLFVAKTEGFWNDLDSYYSRPPPLLSIDHLSATQSDLQQLFRILLTAAHYSGRALTLPSHATILDLPLSPTTPPVRATYSTFPLSQLASQPTASPLNVTILESGYVQHAMSSLMGVSVLDAQERRGKGWWEALGELERERRESKVLELTRVAELDMRQTPTLSSLLIRLLTDPTFLTSPRIHLYNFDWPGFQHWRNWTLPNPVMNVPMCARLDVLPGCDEVCRFEGERGVRVEEGGWPELADVLQDE